MAKCISALKGLCCEFINWYIIQWEIMLNPTFFMYKKHDGPLWWIWTVFNLASLIKRVKIHPQMTMQLLIDTQGGILYISLTSHMNEVLLSEQYLTSGIPAGRWGWNGHWAGDRIYSWLLGSADAVPRIKLIISTSCRDKTHHQYRLQG